MPVSYKVDQEQRWVHTMFWGEVGLADVLSAIDRGLVDPQIASGFAEIVDLTEVTRMDLSDEDLHVIANKSPFSLTARRAFVVPEDSGVRERVHMYEVLRQLQGETGIRVFGTLDEALNWVAPTDPAP